MISKTFNLNNSKEIELIGDSFSSPTRRKIIELLAEKSMSAQELREKLNLSKSTISFHLDVLKKAKIIKELPAPNKKGNEKNISLAINELTISFVHETPIVEKTKLISIPIGSYSALKIEKPCAIFTKDTLLGNVDDPTVFLSSEHIFAEAISFTKGYVVYTARLDKNVHIDNLLSIEFSLEVCSECPYYNNDWKSDINFYINECKIGTYRSLGDFGGRRGKYTPLWWPNTGTQYGNIVTIKVDLKGSYINNKFTNKITLNDLRINKYINFKISVDESSHYKGGVNIFGKAFGDYSQDIELKINYLENK